MVHVKWYRRTFYSVSISVCSLQILATILIPTEVGDQVDQLHNMILVLIVNYALLTVIQSFILILLICTLQRIGGAFSRKNIIIQFALFLLSFLCDLGFCSQVLISKVD